MLNLLLLIGGNGPQFQLGWVFWIFMVVLLLGGFWWNREPPYRRYLPYHAAIWFCIFLLGWGVFGLPGIGR